MRVKSADNSFVVSIGGMGFVNVYFNNDVKQLKFSTGGESRLPFEVLPSV
jgi:hypothetical protein